MTRYLVAVAVALLAALTILGLGWQMVAEGGCPMGQGSPLAGSGCVDGGQP